MYIQRSFLAISYVHVGLEEVVEQNDFQSIT